MFLTNQIAKKVQLTHRAPYTFSLELLIQFKRQKLSQKKPLLVNDDEDGKSCLV